MNNKLETGTTTVGIKCKDGIVLAADRRATAGNLVVDKEAKKVYIIDDNVALTTAGGVSDIQLLLKLIKAEIKLKEVSTGRKARIKEIANLLALLVYENIRKFSLIPGISQFLLGGKEADKDEFYLYDIFPDGSLTEVKKFVCSGSGSELAYGVLEANYKENMKIEDAIKLAIKAVNSALQRDTASGEGIDVVTITKEGAKKVYEKKIEIKLD